MCLSLAHNHVIRRPTEYIERTRVDDTWTRASDLARGRTKGVPGVRVQNVRLEHVLREEPGM